MSRQKLFEKLAEYRELPEGYYHLVFDSIEDGQLFHDDKEYVAGMNTVALAQYTTGLVILVFNWMINHGHFLVWGAGDTCVAFFLKTRRRLNEELIIGGHKPLDDDYGMKLIRIKDRRQLADVAVYIARNPPKACPMLSPSGYIWGTNYLLFSDVSKLISKVPVGDFSSAFFKKLLKTKVALPDNYLFNKELGMILPESYARVELVANAFGNATVYCEKLMKNIDAHVKIAEGVGERVTIDDNELDYVIWSIVRNQFKVSSVTELGNDDRCRLAVILRKKYYVEPKRIARKVGLPLNIVQELIV